MPDVRAQLIISARDEATATMKSVGGATKDTGVSMMDLYAGVRLAEMGLRAIKGAFDAVITPTTTLADETRKLQNTIGGTAEDAGKLIYAADQTGVSFSTLETGLKASIRALQSHKAEGIEPNIEGLATLSDRFLAIQDPIQQSAFLMHNFGRSGVDLAQFMKLGGDAIRSMGDQASATGMVMSQQGVDSTYKYEQSVKELDATFTGLKVKIGEQVIPVVLGLAQAMNQETNFQAVLTQAQKDGIDTSKYVNTTTQDGIKIVTNQKDAIYELTGAIAAQAAAAKQTTDASDRLRTSTADNVPVFTDMADRVSIMTDKDYGLTKGELALQDAAQKASDALQQQIGVGLDNAAMSTVITSAQKNYTDLVTSSKPEIDKLTQSIADMTAGQGKAYTITTDSKYSQEEYSLAILKSADAAKKLADYTGTDQEKLLELKIAAEQASGKVTDMGKQMGTTTTGVADYTTKLADAKSKLSDLQQKEADAEAAIAKTTGAFILQQVAIDQKLTPAMTLQLEKALGLISQKEFDLAQNVISLTKAYDFNKNGIIDAGTEMDAYTKGLVGLQTQSDKVTTDVLPPFTSHVGGAADKLSYAKEQALGLGGAIDALHDKTINIYTNTINTTTNAAASSGHNYVDANGVYHYAQGGDFIVPPGFNENFPIGPGGGASSGERVTVTPAGQSGGGSGKSDALLAALMTQLPDMMARSVRDAMQLR